MVIVEIEQGPLKGTKSTSFLSEKPYYKFLGIPYAKPPIGDLRFQAPEPHEGWDGVLDATIERSQCMQKDGISRTFRGDENCLFLNVYVPDKTKSEKDELYPVMVYIHGGAFTVGSGSIDLYSPDYLINYDVILVTINYRLHVLGFLNLGLPECAGNMGLKDQTLALKWIKRNIKSFGGDNENVTLFGESSGGSSVNYHMISPLSKGLFNRCIAQSGSALASWAYSDMKLVEKSLEVLGTQLEYQYRNNHDFLLFLKTVTDEKLAIAADATADIILEMYPALTYPMCFLPSVEKVKEGAFLPDRPEVLSMNSISVPVMAGVTDSEADMLFPNFAPIQLAYDTINLSFESLIQSVVPEIKLNDQKFKEKCEPIKKFYFGGKRANEEIYEEMMDFYSDIHFTIPLYNSIRKVLQSNQPVYVYNFTFSGNVRFCDIYGPRNPKLKKATHCDELLYLFYGSLYNVSEEFLHKDPESSIIRNICALWTNFAKNGNPNGENVEVTWTPTSIGNHCHLQIDRKLSLIQARIKEDRLKIWEDF